MVSLPSARERRSARETKFLTLFLSVAALAESFKFTRLFVRPLMLGYLYLIPLADPFHLFDQPLSQYDLPSSLASPPLSFSPPTSSPAKSTIPATPSRPMIDSGMPTPLEMTEETLAKQPLLDYTTPELVSARSPRSGLPRLIVG
jgi:translation initiation factor eIF-2B subunit alpha